MMIKPIPKPKLSLASHVAKLKAQKEASPMANLADDTIIFWGCNADKSYLPYLKPCVGSSTVLVRLEAVTTMTTLKMYCKQKRVTRVISSNIGLLTKLLNWTKRAAPSLANYAGSYFKIAGMTPADPEIEIVFIAPLKHLIAVPYGRMVATRLITKLTKPENWFEPTEFKGFTILTPANEASLFAKHSQAKLCCIDIETFKENAVIRCLSYTSFFYDPSAKRWSSDTVVLPIDSSFAVSIMRRWNWELKSGKIFQNGKYDISYLARYNAPVYNYLYDTANLFHCWYSELPKDLGFLNSFFIREAVYWKDLSSTNDLYEYYRYNGLDTWGTGNCFLAMLNEAPEYAINNYLLEFPLTFPCHLSEMTGIARDMDRLELGRAGQQEIIDTAQKSLNKILGVTAGTDFNVSSPKQMKSLLKLLGCSDLPSTDATNIKKARFRHPFNARILGLAMTIRKARKLVSTYLTAGKEFSTILPRNGSDGKPIRPRILYSLNPHGTDTSRLASKEHHFWCGVNIQNIPRGKHVKQTYIADPGFRLVEVDLEQAESRDTAYISGDAQLIQNVEYSPDFHCANASAFFGVPFDELFDVATGKVLNKPLRQIGKPVNHGANYNMGAFVLITTMGEEMVLQAKQLLGLPKLWDLVRVAEYLLEQFHKTYPGIKKVFYAGMMQEVLATRMISSTAVHHDWKHAPTLKANPKQVGLSMQMKYADYAGKAWVRYCFSDPTKSKSALNAYVAHPPQSLNAQTLNKSYLSVFKDIAINPQHSSNFKLCAQVHDSILFQHRVGHEHLIDEVVKRMEVPVTIKAYDGKVRTFVVPAGAKHGQHLEQGYAKYWSETE